MALLTRNCYKSFTNCLYQPSRILPKMEVSLCFGFNRCLPDVSLQALNDDKSRKYAMDKDYIGIWVILVIEHLALCTVLVKGEINDLSSLQGKWWVDEGGRVWRNF